MTDRLLINDVASPASHALPGPLIRKVTWIGITVNIALAIFKLAAGIYGDSQAVIADGTEALLDVFTVILVYAGSRLWTRPPDDTHPFGHGRMETLVAVGIAVTGAILLPSWTFLDHLGAVVVSMFILHAAFKIAWPSLKHLIVDVGLTVREGHAGSSMKSRNSSMSWCTWTPPEEALMEEGRQ